MWRALIDMGRRWLVPIAQRVRTIFVYAICVWLQPTPRPRTMVERVFIILCVLWVLWFHY